MKVVCVAEEGVDCPAPHRERLYANVDELYDDSPEEEEDPYSYGNESIYDSICYYQAPVRGCGLQRGLCVG